jgi:hypothetical protein
MFHIKDMLKEGNKLMNGCCYYKSIKVIIFEKFLEMFNIKNKKPYTLLTDEVINATNNQDGQKMVLYTDGEKLYVREIEEFNNKFTK